MKGRLTGGKEERQVGRQREWRIDRREKSGREKKINGRKMKRKKEGK